MHEHEVFIQRCLDLAVLGMGAVSPNPIVGALLVHQGKVIAENYHRQYGGPHAEALVVQQVLAQHGEVRASEIFMDSTLYVSLEPCSHQGKTPPCADLIVRHRIPRVVVAMNDPSEKVNGQGIAKLRDANIHVTTGVLESEAQWVSRRFITQIQRHRPYIILKWAQTADGLMAPLEQQQRWITGPEARQLVHRWRSEEDAVLVGCGTALADNPRLDVREWKGRNPKRILIDRDLVVAPSAFLFNDAAETIVFNADKSDVAGNIRHVALENFDLYLPEQISYQLYLMDVQSLIVEGGMATLDRFIRAGLWDEARIFTSPTEWKEGRAAPRIDGPDSTLLYTSPVGRDELKVFKNVKQ